MSEHNLPPWYQRPARFTYPDELKIRIGQLADRMPVRAVAQLLKISESTVNKCHQDYGGDIKPYDPVETQQEARQLVQAVEECRRSGRSAWPLWMRELVREAKAHRHQ
jgi:hypothetical protein